jgi:hypothetical protein
MPKRPPGHPRGDQRWATFLQNHCPPQKLRQAAAAGPLCRGVGGAGAFLDRSRNFSGGRRATAVSASDAFGLVAPGTAMASAGLVRLGCNRNVWTPARR